MCGLYFRIPFGPWDDVVCRLLGYGSALAAVDEALFGQVDNSLPIWSCELFDFSPVYNNFTFRVGVYS